MANDSTVEVREVAEPDSLLTMLLGEADLGDGIIELDIDSVNMVGAMSSPTITPGGGTFVVHC